MKNKLFLMACFVMFAANANAASYTGQINGKNAFMYPVGVTPMGVVTRNTSLPITSTSSQVNANLAAQAYYTCPANKITYQYAAHVKDSSGNLFMGYSNTNQTNADRAAGYASNLMVGIKYKTDFSRGSKGNFFPNDTWNSLGLRMGPFQTSVGYLIYN